MTQVKVRKPNFIHEPHMIKLILIATDGSEHADKAVKLGAEMAKAHGAQIILLHALPESYENQIPQEYLKWAEIEHVAGGDVLHIVGDEILKRAEALAKQNGAEKIECLLPMGPAAKSIVKAAKSKHADIIVVGCRGLSDVEGLFLGSVSHKVSNLAPCSCVTVR